MNTTDQSTTHVSGDEHYITLFPRQSRRWFYSGRQVHMAPDRSTLYLAPSLSLRS